MVHPTAFVCQLISNQCYEYEPNLKKFRHEILSMKVPNVEFDFDEGDCMMQVVTDTLKISMRPYNSVQMSHSTYYLDVLFAWLQLCRKLYIELEFDVRYFQ